MSRTGTGRRTEAFEVSSENELRGALLELAQAFEGRLLAPRKELREYLDTFDWRVQRAGGWLCATPRADGQVELLASASGRRPRKARAAHMPEFAQDLPAGPVRSAFEQLVTPRRLATVAKVVRKSQVLELVNVEGKVFARVTAVVNELPGVPVPTATYALLLEGVRGYRKERHRVARWLRQSQRLPPTNASEFDAILPHLGPDAGRDPSALDVELSPEMSAREALGRVLLRLCEVVEVNRDGVLEGRDSEFLHDLRVAVRRTRSILDQITGVLPDAGYAHYAEEFRWLGELTGRARDLDVFLLNMPAYRRQLARAARRNPAKPLKQLAQSGVPGELCESGQQDLAALQALTRLLIADRKKQQVRLTRALRGKRVEALLRDWKALLREPADLSGHDAAPPRADLPVIEVASDCIWKRYRKVRRRGRAIDRDTPDAELHSLRIQCKKLRYLLEVFRSLYPAKPIGAGIKHLNRLQNTLGEFNDARVQADLLRGFAERLGRPEDGSPDTVVAIDQLVSALLEGGERERERFFDRFDHFASDENHARFRKLFRRVGGG